MSRFVTVAYQLGCQCAADVFDKTSSAPAQAARAAARQVTRRGARRGAKAVAEEASAAAPVAEAPAAEAKGLWDRFMGSRGAQYAAGGLGGAGAGALMSGEDNRLRGAMMGAGLGLGGVAGARSAIGSGKSIVDQTMRLNRTPAEFAAAQKELGPEGLSRLAKSQERLETGIGAGVGGLGGLIAGRGLAPGHEAPEKPWLERARGLLPF